MPEIKVRVLQNGDPLQGAKVYALASIGAINATTNAQGEVSTTVGGGWGPEPVGIVVSHSSGEAGGMYLLTRDVPLVIEV
jgi:uncharacterized protein YfaS (alpha-2-macroglobulin family)